MGTNRRILFRLQESLLASQLVKTFQPLCVECFRFHGRAHCASRFAFVPAIAELTSHSQLLNLAEGVSDSLARVPQLQFAHSRSVNQYSSTWNNNQLSRGGGVPSAIVAFANTFCFLERCSKDGIDERRFSNSGRTKERRSDACLGHAGSVFFETSSQYFTNLRDSITAKRVNSFIDPPG